MTWLSSNAPAVDPDPDVRSDEGTMDWTWQDLTSGSQPEDPRAPDPEELEAIREKERAAAHERGFHEGVEAGRRQALKELGPNLEASVRVVEEMEEFREALLEQLQENVTLLSLAIARHLVDREVKVDPEVVENLVRSALSHFPLDQAVRIRLNPQDLSAMSGDPDPERPPVAAGREVRWIPDESVSRGGCVVEGPERIVDGRLETAVERIYRKVSDG